MLPRPRPEMSAEPIIPIRGRSPNSLGDGAQSPKKTAALSGRLYSCFSPRLLLHADRDDLIIDELCPNIIVLVQRVVLLRAEGLGVGLDEPVVAIDLVVPIAYLRSLGRARVLNGERGKHHRIVGVRHADGGRDVARALDVRILR